MRNSNLIIAYTARNFAQWSSGRSFLLTAMATQTVPALIGLLVWSNILEGDEQVLTYYVVLMAVQLVSVSYENYLLAEKIYTGEIVDQMLLPHSPIIASIGSNLGMRAWHIVLGSPIIALAIVVTGASTGVSELVATLPAVALASAIVYVFTFLIATLAFWFERVDALDNFTNALLFLLGGASAPIFAFPSILHNVAVLLPFRYMLSFPAELAAGELSARQAYLGYAGQFIWLAAMITLSALLWRAGTRQYTAVGG